MSLCKECGSEKIRVSIPCPDGDSGCIVRHFVEECLNCKDLGYRVNIKPDATLAELIVFLNGMFHTSDISITGKEAIPKGIERHFDKIVKE